MKDGPAFAVLFTLVWAHGILTGLAIGLKVVGK